jgi:hypothetical protein
VEGAARKSRSYSDFKINKVIFSKKYAAMPRAIWTPEMPLKNPMSAPQDALAIIVRFRFCVRLVLD